MVRRGLAVVGRIKVQLLVAVASGLSALAQTCATHTGRWERIVGEDNYAKELASKHSLAHKFTKELGEDVASLYTAIYDLSS